MRDQKTESHFEFTEKRDKITLQEIRQGYDDSK